MQFQIGLPLVLISRALSLISVNLNGLDIIILYSYPLYLIISIFSCITFFFLVIGQAVHPTILNLHILHPSILRLRTLQPITLILYNLHVILLIWHILYSFILNLDKFHAIILN